MSAVIGESLLYEAHRITQQSHRLSYFQYRALSSFAELLILHDNALVLTGTETDIDFLRAIKELVRAISTDSDFNFEFVSSENQEAHINNSVIQRFEIITKEIYLRPLGLVTGQLLKKVPKDRTAEDMSERVEHLFTESVPTAQNRKFVEELLRVWSRNANSSELLYFFRAHLIQALAEVREDTALYENQRLIADILHHTYRPKSYVGTLPFVMYTLVNGVFMRLCDALGQDKSNYPRPSLFLSDIGGSANSRDEILPRIIALRNEFKPFRKYYDDVEKQLRSDTTSIFDKADIRDRLNDTVNKVLIPTISSAGRTYSASRIGKFFKDMFSRYGIGDLTIEHSIESEQSGSDSTDSITLATPSLGGVATTVAQTAYSGYQEAKMLKPNKPLLDCLMRVLRSTEGDALQTHLPVHDFGYQLNALLDRAVLERLPEV